MGKIKNMESISNSSIILILIGLLLILFLFLIASASSNKKHRKNEKERKKIEIIEADKRKRRIVTKNDKQIILQRDNYTCQICGISKMFFDDIYPGLGDYLLLEIDHIISVADGGDGKDINNLQTLCWRCNRKKSGHRTNDDVRKMIDYGMSHFM